MQIFLAQLINGLGIGSMYSVLTTGLNLLLLIGGVFHYAYPHVVVLSMYVLWGVLVVSGGNIALGVLSAIGASVGLSLATEPLFRPVAKRGAIVLSFILSLGLAVIFTDIMGRQIHSGIPIAFPTTLTGKEAIWRWGIATITLGQVFTIIGSAGAVVGLLYLLYRTRQGRGFRAMAQNPFVARLLGIPIGRMSIYGYAIAGLLGGITAVFLAMSLGVAAAPVANILALKVFAVALFAGVGNLRGGLIGGIILGLAESFTLGYLPGDWSNAIAFAMIMGVVMWKPEGLFGLRA